MVEIMRKFIFPCIEFLNLKIILNVPFYNLLDLTA